MAPLPVWHNGVEWVVDESAEAAAALIAEHTGCDPEEADGDGWERWADDRPLTIGHDPDDARKLDGFGTHEVVTVGDVVYAHIPQKCGPYTYAWVRRVSTIRVTAPAAEWSARLGRGALCSTEW